MSQKYSTIKQKNIKKLLEHFSFILLFIFCFIYSTNAKADLSKCRDPELQRKVEQVAKEEGVNSNELLSIVAHESRCNYFVIAWNLPKAPQTAKNKFFESLLEAKSFAEELVATRKYRVDIGIGQINYEANIQRKGWTLNEVLDPKTALNRVAQILKERGWDWYHSSNLFYAKRWRKSALQALNRLAFDSAFSKEADKRNSRGSLHEKSASLLIYSRTGQQFLNFSDDGSSFQSKVQTNPIIVYRRL